MSFFLSVMGRLSLSARLRKVVEVDRGERGVATSSCLQGELGQRSPKKEIWKKIGPSLSPSKSLSVEAQVHTKKKVSYIKKKF